MNRIFSSFRALTDDVFQKIEIRTVGHEEKTLSMRQLGPRFPDHALFFGVFVAVKMMPFVLDDEDPPVDEPADEVRVEFIL